MLEENVLERPPVVTSGGGSLGTQGAGGSGAPAGDEFDRLAAMLESIRKY
jgi:hypothetical protein